MKGLSKVDQSLQRDNSPGLQLNVHLCTFECSLGELFLRTL